MIAVERSISLIPAAVIIATVYLGWKAKGAWDAWRHRRAAQRYRRTRRIARQENWSRA